MSGQAAGPDLGVDTFTLLAVIAMILSVMALAFLAAWRGQRGETYWLSWIGGNAALALGVLCLLLDRSGTGALVALGNCFLVLGFGLKWQAARLFGGRSLPPVLIVAPVVFVVVCFALPMVLRPATVFTAVNLLLTAQTLATAHEFWRDRGDGLPSRSGLVLSYGIMGVSFGARVVQGLFFGPGETTYLPHDLMLQIHLVVAVLHITSAGAFALSISYERGAQELRTSALTDALTGLANRRAFEARMRGLCRARAEHGASLVLFDLDHFKTVNDVYGHSAGDEALRRCGQVLHETLAASGLVARIGGEEFAALLEGVTAEEACSLTERARRAIERCEIDVDGRRFGITLSAGVYRGEAGDGFDAMMRRADRSLYRAKDAGRNRVARAAA